MSARATTTTTPSPPQKQASAARKRLASGAEKNKRPEKRARVDLAAPAPASDTDLHLLTSVADVPGPADLLDQVFAAVGGCMGLGARVEFAWEPEPGRVRDEVARFVVARKEALAAQDADDQRRREAGETVARRSKYYDDVTPDPTVDTAYTVVPQQWVPPAPPDASAPAPALGAPDVPTRRIFLTHQIVDAVCVTFETCQPTDAAAGGGSDTDAFTHMIRVRIEAGGAPSALEVRYFLHEDLVHEIQTGPTVKTEDRKMRRVFADCTWIDTIPFVLATGDWVDEPFCKRMRVALPGDCDAEVSEDLLLLKRALRIHDHADAAANSLWKYRRTEVHATRAFHGALTAGCVSDADARLYHLRWLQLTPIGPSAYRADNAGGEVDDLYASDDETIADDC